ncbi:DUF6308 family protein [Cellulomonas denverensis]|uniref:Uncharacterized protein n=1 Tax=Cellulomonas denverensis TaxID=264297 RepID=A0A7X6KSI2_9CELL|nr:DUF6308 family protein [Cellulomonas denverensis]NKY21481.1 hypothetical protein [Cellulomonas denverensis]GIG26993.1 hypothetical protein Cde04nite_32370 [Cellulomonas denverensis]
MLTLSPRLATLLSPEHTEDATALLRTYFAPRSEGGFTGAYFEHGIERDPDEFTADDLVAVSMLSVSIPGRAAIELLHNRRTELNALLRAVGPDRPLADLTEDEVGDGWAVRPLYRALLGIPGIGETRATKLLARKRPHLVPILDSVVSRELGIVKGRYWQPLHAWLVADDRAGHRRLEDLRAEAGLAPSVSALRVFDVLAWTVGRQAGSDTL